MAEWYDSLPLAGPVPGSPPSAVAANPQGLPSAADLMAEARAGPSDQYKPSPQEAGDMANDLQQIAARKSGGNGDWFSNLPLAPQPAAMDVANAANPPAPMAPNGKPALTGPVTNLGAGANEFLANNNPISLGVNAAASVLRGPGGTPQGVTPEMQAAFNQRHPTAGAVNSALDWWHSQFNNPIGGTNSIKSALGMIGADPRNVAPANGLDRAMRGAGNSIGAMVAPYAGARMLLGSGLANAGPLMDTLANGSLLGNASVGAGAGVGGSIAQDLVPDQYKPLANMGGQLLGGGMVAAPAAAAKFIGGAASDLLGRLLAPFSDTGRTNIAARRIQAAATNPATAANAVDTAPSFVPGSVPTTAQASNDPGLLAFERPQATKNPDQFNARRAEQQGAQVSALNNVQPTGDPAQVGNFVRQQLEGINARHDQAVGTATNTASDARSALGGQSSAQDSGSAIRGILGDQKAQAKGHESDLWNAIDPDKKLAIDVGPAKDAGAAITTGVSPYAKPIEGEEGAIYKALGSAPETMKFSDLTDLRGRLLGEIRAERQANGDTPALRRMQQLRAAMDDTIATGAQRQAALEQQAVARGEMAPEDSILGRYQRTIENWYNARDAVAKTGTGQDAGAGAGNNAGSGSAAIPGVVRAGSAPRGQFGGSAGNPGLQGGEQSLASNFDTGAAQRYRNAADATRQRVETFNTGATGQALRPGSTAGSYRVPDSQVAGKFFNSTGHAAEDVQSFIKASGGRQDAIEALHEYAASDLLKKAQGPDGTLNPAKTDKWIAAHQDALAPFPELTEKFRTASSAQQAVDESAATRTEALKAQQHYIATKAIGADPQTAIVSALKSANPTAEITKLTRWASLDRTGQAIEGLRRSAVEYMQNRFITESMGNEALKSQKFLNFVRENRPALGYLLPGDRMKVIENIAADLQRTNPVRGKLSASPGTAQDITGVKKTSVESGEGHTDNLMIYFMSELLGHASGHILAGPAGAVVLKVGSLFRSAGLRKADDIVTQAMLDPELGKTLLMKFTGSNRSMVLTRLQSQLKTLGAVSAADSRNR